MILPFGCGSCDNRWSGFTTCHCSECHRTFSGLTVCALHRRGGTCVDPAALTKAGLVQRYRPGYAFWGTEMDDATRTRFERRRQNALTDTCTRCGRQFGAARVLDEQGDVIDGSLVCNDCLAGISRDQPY